MQRLRSNCAAIVQRLLFFLRSTTYRKPVLLFGSRTNTHTKTNTHTRSHTITPTVVRAAALALRDVPQANAKWNTKTQSVDSGSGIVDIAIAVATPNGLITPIVTGANKRGVSDINAAIKGELR
jgi:pyruvate/2-oxoglutarate dehydrogenase complex dihydrolipoamide acyltransferase (E2) component